MAEDKKEFMVEGAQIFLRNFSGKERQFNPAGQRNFLLVLSEEMAETLSADGWNVKVMQSKDEDGEDTIYIAVAVRFDIKPPKITMITNGGNTRTILDEDNVDILDVMDIANIDLICSAYEWNFNGKSGTKAYLKTMFVTIDEDALEQKYSHVGSEE